MKYIKLFKSHSDYETFKQSEDFVTPNVSYCVAENEVHYNPLANADKYLTFEALKDGTFKFSNPINYSIDNGITWNELASDTNSPTVTKESKIIWKATDLTPTSGAGIGTFSSTGKFNVEGNAMSLLYGDDFRGAKSLIGKDWAFKSLFLNCTNIVSAENLSLPAKKLGNNCYEIMFNGCTNLTTAPELPAKVLTQSCYAAMFKNCKSLTTAPELPATTLAGSCYQSMFDGCTNLTTAPELPATTLVNSCYSSMFRNCTNLTTAPELPAKTLMYKCYEGMFNGCTNLTTAQQLPATTLAQSCYENMFANCINLITAPQLPATTLVKSCYLNMFSGCTSLNYIKAMFTTTPGSYTQNWVKEVAASGTFVKNSAAEWDVTGANGIPSGWTVEYATLSE